MNKNEDARRDAPETPSTAEAVPGAQRKSTKRSAGSKAKSSKKQKRKKSPKQGAPRRPYPRATLEQALRIPLALKDKNGGNAWPPADVAKAINLSVNNTDFFYLAAASRDFGLTDGGRDSDQISLTPFGRDVVYAPSKAEEEKQLRQALAKVDIFNRVLGYYKGANLPEMQYLGNTLLREFQLPAAFHEEFSRLFKENCAYLKIGSGFSPNAQPNALDKKVVDDGSTVLIAEPKSETGLRCFVAMPFKEHEQGHPTGFFDEVLRSLIAPSGRDAGFSVSTANRDGSDIIQATIVNQLLDADLVIVDLTENNPNVLFELGLRIAEQKPVAIIRAKGTPPIFDVDNMLRVYEYDPNLWPGTVVQDKPKLTEHIKGAWASRESKMTFIGILRERRG
jgi:hypothetical protein